VNESGSGVSDDPDGRPPTDVTTSESRDEGGVEVTGGRAAVEPAGGVPTESRIFGALGAFYLGAGIVYWFLSYEWAGFAMLVFAGVFAFTAAGYFWAKLRGVQQEVEDADADAEAEDAPPEHPGLYLPHTSVWPIGIGIGAAVTMAGIAIGWWFLIPGALLLLHSIIGFAAQSRDRS
jgi:hypothetical protein